jgi:hypothetical protein
VITRFDEGKISSNVGGLLLREVERRIHLLGRLSDCFLDGREQGRVRHSVREMLSQRVYGLALGYEDLNDREQLRHDWALMLLAGSAEPEDPLAGKSTLNRLELAAESGVEDRYKESAVRRGGQRRVVGADLSGSIRRNASGDRDRLGRHRSATTRAAGAAIL